MQAVWVSRKGGGKDFEGNRAIEASVAGAVDFAHAASA
jgi:hypothetical protein